MAVKPRTEEPIDLQDATPQPPEEPTEQEEPTDQPEPAVVFDGHFGLQRMLTREDWDREGISDRRAETWDKHNNFRVPVSNFTKEELAVLRRQPGFTVEGENN